MSSKFEVLVMMLIVFGCVWCFDYKKCYLLSEFTLDCSSAKYKTNDFKAEVIVWLFIYLNLVRQTFQNRNLHFKFQKNLIFYVFQI